MSGILAFKGECSAESLQHMIEKLQHRGPDQQNVFQKDDLKIVELSWEERPAKIVFNSDALVLDGELFLNDRELTKPEMLQFYQEKGPDFIKNLEGNYALVLSDGNDIFAARDVLGVKPLYYIMGENFICFASEMKALIEYSSDIKTFPPGYYYTQAGGLQKYKDIPVLEKDDRIEYSHGAAKVKELLAAAVERIVHKEEEKPGYFLSGGLDSSVLVAIACKASNKKVRTFAAGFEGSVDVINARVVSKYLGTQHREYIYDPEEMIEVLPEVIYYLESFDVELVNSSIANFFVSKLARDNGVRVILSGEGADELFAGYHFLKECDNERELNSELDELLKGLHNGGVQRVDRMTKAHSLECKMPFMDPGVVNFALQLPARWKIREETGKWILRKAFEGELPDEIIWRRKAQFGIGSGNEDVMKKFIDEKLSDEIFYREDKKNAMAFKSKEEYYYYKIFRNYYPEALVKTVNRWLVDTIRQ